MVLGPSQNLHQEVENKAADLSMALRTQFLLSSGEDPRSQGVTESEPLTRRMLLQFLGALLPLPETTLSSDSEKLLQEAPSIGESWWKGL